MARQNEEDAVQVGIWIRRDLVNAVNNLRHEWRLDTKRAAWEHLLEHALSNPPPPPTKS